MRGVWIVVAVVMLLAPLVSPYPPDLQDRQHGNEAPSRTHWLGTDEYGRDVFSRYLFGGRLSIAGGLTATLLALCLATLLGAAAGLGGRWLDEALMRATELFLSLPWLYLLLALRAALPLHLPAGAAFGLVVVVIALVGWARPARLIRGVVLAAKGKQYVRIAQAMGAKRSYVFLHHIFPQLRGVMEAQASVIFPQFVLADMTLSFLGLGTGEPTASWGSLLANLRQFSVMDSHWGRWAPIVLMMLFFAGMQIFLRISRAEGTIVETSANVQ